MYETILAEIKVENRQASKAEAKAAKAMDKAESIHALALSIGGYFARSLGDAVKLADSLKTAKSAYKLSNKALIAAMVESVPTVNAGDIRDVLSIGRAVAVAPNYGFDLVLSCVSLTAARTIGRALQGLEESGQTDILRQAFAAACEGKDVKAVLPKRTVKPKTETTVSALDALKVVLEHLHEYDESSLDALKAGLELLAKSESADPVKLSA